MTGISGEPEASLGRAHIPLLIPGLPNATFEADMIGNQGSWCPALMPCSTAVKYRMCCLFGALDKGDGILMIHQNTDPRVADAETEPILVRLLATDSGHYLIPTDNADPREHEQAYLQKRVWQHLTGFCKTCERNGTTPTGSYTGNSNYRSTPHSTDGTPLEPAPAVGLHTAQDRKPAQSRHIFGNITDNTSLPRSITSTHITSDGDGGRPSFGSEDEARPGMPSSGRSLGASAAGQPGAYL